MPLTRQGSAHSVAHSPSLPVGARPDVQTRVRHRLIADLVYFQIRVPATVLISMVFHYSAAVRAGDVHTATEDIC
jgi:hypothetical protein